MVPGPPRIQALTGAATGHRRPPSSHAASIFARLHCWYNIVLWVLVALLLFSHSFGIAISSVTSMISVYFGRDPALGQYQVPGFNDEAFTNRSFACIRSGRTIHPVQLSQLIAQQKSKHRLPPSSSVGVDGYRVIPRENFIMDAGEITAYVMQCRAHANALITPLSSLRYGTITRPAAYSSQATTAALAPSSSLATSSF